MFPDMARRLQGHTKKELCAKAKSHARSHGTPRPDRLSHRNRDALICFFCEAFPDFPEGFPEMNPTPTPTSYAGDVPLDDEWMAFDDTSWN
jgi:hypothetical protein